MSRAKLFALLTMSVLVIVPLTAAQASAAGPPKNVSVENNEEFAGWTDVGLRLIANPNGSNTTATIETRTVGTEEWTIASTQSLGAGTTNVKSVPEVYFRPNTKYEFRASATNTFGTTYSSVHSGAYTRWRGEVPGSGKQETLEQVPYVLSNGKGTFEFRYIGLTFRIDCDLGGSGIVGTVGGAGDSHQYFTSNCKQTVQGEQWSECKIKGFSFGLTGTLATEKPEIKIPFTGNCGPWEGLPWEHEYKFTVNPFLLFESTPLLSHLTNPEEKATAQGHMSTLQEIATISLQAHWSLTGPYSGRKLWLNDFGF